MFILAGLIAGVAVWSTAAPGLQKRPTAGRSTAPTGPTPRTPPAAEAGLLPWSLAAPLSREVVLPDTHPGKLLVLGGLSSGSSERGVYAVSTATGAASLVGNLAQATHDAAGANIDGRAFVFGGGASTTSASNQQLSTSGVSALSGQLPAARADASAVTIGKITYVVGGYDGRTMDAAVLATSDGHSFRVVVPLLVPVRYAAVAALGGRIYVLGGENAQGHAVASTQIIDPGSRSIRLGPALPAPIAGATAAAIGGTIYLAGGLSGPGSGSPAKTIYAFDSADGAFLRAGALPVAVSNAGAAVLANRLYLVGGETAGGAGSSDVQVIDPNRAFGSAGHAGAGSPYYGDELLVADRGNDRLILLDDTGKVIWTYPSASKPAPPGGFYFPDDAFFIDHGNAIISNQEENETVVEIAYPSGKLLFTYGHPKVPGSTPGYLDNPDDAYLLRNGDISVADPMNCRVLVINQKTKHVLTQIGTVGSCSHNPPSGVGSPNGDTPLADGNLLISEINGNWIDEYTPTGRLVWDCQLRSVGYVSDPQQMSPDRYLVADYASPGAFVEFNRKCEVLYRYGPASGPGALNHPSLVEQLPSGVLMANDDYNDRIVATDPATGALVWQYGTTGVAGTAAGLLNTPDGFDLLAPDGATPTHLATG